MREINLNGEWRLTSPQHGGIAVPMMIPGDNVSALLKAGLILDPYIGLNEQACRWIETCDWHIEREFKVSSDTLSAKEVRLSMTRVDTLARLFVNDKEVLGCDNMFTRYQLDIKPFLMLGSNRIRIEFSRVDSEGLRRAQALPFPIPSAMGNNQIPHMNLIRKTQCHSGWDWGICLMVSGIYDPILIDVIDDLYIEQCSTEQHWQPDGSVKVMVSFKATVYQDTRVEIGFNGRVETLEITQNGYYQCEFHVRSPKLWWPAGYGAPYLYPLAIKSSSQTLLKRVGLRTLSLNTKEDESGSAMEFVINGCAIMAKGANWIPLDAMPERECRQRYHQLLQSAVDANMNMIRVWGGGQYESEDFYDLCDELGLLVWQDMMFACSLYPSNNEFLSQVEQELRYQIPRLKQHASVVLWCGDNEVIGAIGWYDESKNNKVKYTVNYDRLNRSISDVIGQLDQSRPFWPSSPCNGDLDFGDAWHDDSRGDMHFWDVWHSGKPFSAYRDVNPRFCSEFGFQSWPSFAECKSFVPKEDWNITSPTFEQHQKNPRGNSIITEMFTRYFRFPTSFEHMLYLSQVQQAIAIKTACDHWRAISPTCRGILYWQLNDNWPVSSWSSLEYSGRWKQLHYHAKRFFAPQYCVFSQEDEELSLRLLNDMPQEAKIEGRLVWSDWSGNELKAWPLTVQVQPQSNTLVWQQDSQFSALNHETGFLHLEGEINGTSVENTWFSNDKLKLLPLPAASLNVEIEGKEIILTADKPAFFVHLEADTQGRFSDSSFTLLPNQKKRITFMGEDGEAMANTLRVYHLTKQQFSH